MLQQRRRAARCTVDIPVAATVAELGRLDARITDISVGGLALRFRRLLEVNWTVSLSFTLPNTNHLIHVTGRVVNANTCPEGTCRIGICFSFVPEDEFDLLVNWLASELAKLENAEIPVSDALEN
jgi:c-di-GMP-binding flagellar brake protein YcgR